MAKRTTPGSGAAAGPRADDAQATRRIVQDYLAELQAIRASGSGVPETSYYPALSNLFNAVGATLRPRVRCIIHTRNQGAGIPDGGLFTAEQFQRPGDGEPKAGQLPARGAVEAKGTTPEVRAIAESDQVKEYLKTYGIVIVTNLRAFLIVERGPGGRPVPRESFALADDERDFWQRAAAHPAATARERGEPFFEFLRRACLHNAPLVRPKDVAWFLASYARDALYRIERQKELPALQAVRAALEEALGMQFTGEKGEHFFRSTLVQTLFYGVFSAWVRWHKDQPAPGAKFDWRSAEWSLHVPFIRVLYEEVSKPSRLGPLGLVEVLDWAAGVLGRVDRAEFFANFEDEHAVQYFYEPFLEAYDPELRKALGVWYTPPEIVQYQVARVDRVLREELDLPDGLANPNVVVLDPCCGTGAYLVEVLHCIAATLREKGGDALVASDLKQAAMTRVFGFEIMPAPFVVSHLQLSSLLQNQGAPLRHQSGERAGVYLTNALTGWEPPKGPKQRVMAWAELQEERDAADHVKRDERILVVLGNPPYNAFAGVSPQEEQGLVEPYKAGLNAPAAAGGWGIKKFNLDDLYVRFFRLAERRIAEMTGRGVVSFISNHSWISEPSFVVLRQHLLESFDKFWIENLHGNRKISEYAPDGRTSETVFAIRGFSAGIQQGVATSLWVKTGKPRRGPAQVRFRDDIDNARAEERRKHLLATLSARGFDRAYTRARPRPANRYSFRPENVGEDYSRWPKLVDLCAIAPFNGLMEKRGGGLIDVDRGALESRMRDYFDAELSWEEYRARRTAITQDAARCNAKQTRAKALAAEAFDRERLRRYALRPFDTRWCYYTPVRPVWNEPRPALWAQFWEGNAFLMVRPAGVASPEGRPLCFTRALGDNDALRGHAYYVPLRLQNSVRLEKRAEATLFTVLGEKPDPDQPVSNLSPAARAYLAKLGIANPDDVAQPPSAGLGRVGAAARGFTPPGAAVPQHNVPEGNVAQPPSAGLGKPQGRPPAKPGKSEYRRNLPHFQAEGKAIYLTFCTKNRWILPESVRSRILAHCLHDHGRKIHVLGAVVMPDHVHMVFVPLQDAQGNPYTLAEITNGIKGASAHSVNKALGRKGSVWQDESYDHVLRSDESESEKVEYICDNPVRKGLCRREADYPWLWREWVEGQANSVPRRSTPEGGCATIGAPGDGHGTAGLIWMHALAIGYSPAYLAENADGIRRDWPRIPLPADRKALEASAALGEQLAALLDTEADVPGVTCGRIGPLLRTIGPITKTGGGQLDASGGDLAVTAGWGHFGKAGVVMPAKGRLGERAFDADEAAAIDAEAAARGTSARDVRRLLGERTFDVYLNDGAFWRNVPHGVWNYHIGGYQVVKKWLSYREAEILGRPLRPEEAREVTHTVRRLAAILLLGPTLDENYRRAKESAVDWPSA